MAPLPDNSNARLIHHPSSNDRTPISDAINFSMFNEAHRLRSFKNWPLTFMKPQDLAAAGLYYLQKEDFVKCPYCCIEIHKWERGDDPLVDHGKHSPRCRFVTSRRMSSSPESNDDAANRRGYDVCGPYSVSDIHPNANLSDSERSNSSSQGSDTPPNPSANALRTNGSTPHARFPQYASMEARLRTYEVGWPHILRQKLSPNDLADAGFFCVGISDQLLCYYCGGGLNEWDEKDNPWEEHARWFQKCPYVLAVKGSKFVDEVLAKKDKIMSLSEKELKAEVNKHRNVPVTSDPATDNISGSAESPNNNEANVACGSVSKELFPPENESRPRPEDRLCKICFMHEDSCVFIPCNHMMACDRCAIRLTSCPICRMPIQERKTGVIRG